MMSLLVNVLSFSETPSLLVTPAWLAEHSNDQDLVILHVSQNRRDYLNGHIPGARFLWVGRMALSNPELSFEVLPVSQLDTTLEVLGISNTSRIVLCSSGGNVSATARMYITFDYIGMGDRTFILDGGIEAWKKEGHPTAKDIPQVNRGSFMPNVQQNVFVDANYVNNSRDNRDFNIIDARAPEFYSGKNSAGNPRNGHIPGAKNIFYTILFDSTNKYLPIDSLKAKFDLVGVAPGKDIISYCHVGQTASPLYIVARLLGHTAHLYDGSFEDWSGREDLPVESPSK